MTERIRHVTDIAISEPQLTTHLVLEVVRQGGTLADAIDTLTAIGVPRNLGHSITTRLIANGILNKTPEGVVISDQGDAILSAEAPYNPHDLERLTTVSIERRRTMEALGRVIRETVQPPQD